VERLSKFRYSSAVRNNSVQKRPQWSENFGWFSDFQPFLDGFLDETQPDPSDEFRKEPENQPKQRLILNFRPLRAYFEEEAATSTPVQYISGKPL
jgi:hypothetical protein